MNLRDVIMALKDGMLPAAFAQGRVCGIIEDGIYYRKTDIDLILMYCMGDPI